MGIFMTFGKYSVENALQNPQEIFRSPEQVASDPRLDRTTKLAILRKWLESTNCTLCNTNDNDRQGESALGQRLKESITRLSRTGRAKPERSGF